jgi:HEAT repeat protein
MQERTRLFFVGVCVAGSVLIALILHVTERQPHFEGHSLTYWLQRDVDESSYEFRSSHPNSRLVTEPKQALRKIGTNAIPNLLEWIAYEPSPAQLRQAKTLANLRSGPLGFCVPKWALIDQAEHKADLASVGFIELGAQAAPAIPTLAQIANDPTKAKAALRAVNALGDIGPGAVLELTTILTNRAALNRPIAAWRIGQLGTNATQALPAVLQCVADADQDVAVGAIASLRCTGPEDERVFQAMSAALHDSRPRVRLCAEQILWGAGQRAVPLLLHATEDPDYAVRGQAIVILQQLAPTALTNVALLDDIRDPAVRVGAVHQLGRLPQFIPIFKHLLDDPDHAVRVTAARALHEIDPATFTNAPTY